MLKGGGGGFWMRFLGLSRALLETGMLLVWFLSLFILHSLIISHWLQ